MLPFLCVYVERDRGRERRERGLGMQHQRGCCFLTLSECSLRYLMVVSKWDTFSLMMSSFFAERCRPAHIQWLMWQPCDDHVSCDDHVMIMWQSCDDHVMIMWVMWWSCVIWWSCDDMWQSCDDHVMIMWSNSFDVWPLKSMFPMASYHTGFPSLSSPKNPPGKHFFKTLGKEEGEWGRREERGRGAWGEEEGGQEGRKRSMGWLLQTRNSWESDHGHSLPGVSSPQG